MDARCIQIHGNHIVIARRFAEDDLAAIGRHRREYMTGGAAGERISLAALGIRNPDLGGTFGRRTDRNRHVAIVRHP